MHLQLNKPSTKGLPLLPCKNNGESIFKQVLFEKLTF